MKTILIVDDEEKVRKLVEVTLAVENHSILHASSGEEALAVVRQARPDVCVLDIRMPGRLDGLDVCRLIKKDPKTRNIYVIMLTAMAQQEDRKKGADAGADEYFVKPFSPMKLLDKIEEILG